MGARYLPRQCEAAGRYPSLCLHQLKRPCDSSHQPSGSTRAAHSRRAHMPRGTMVWLVWARRRTSSRASSSRRTPSGRTGRRRRTLSAPIRVARGGGILARGAAGRSQFPRDSGGRHPTPR
eukprot:scaffold591_cov372-Prasinococcus_capsulatus_cf.AAC.9